MAEIVRLTTYPKIGRAAPNQLANSKDNTIYNLTTLPTPASLLPVNPLLFLTL